MSDTGINKRRLLNILQNIWKYTAGLANFLADAILKMSTLTKKTCSAAKKFVSSRVLIGLGQLLQTSKIRSKNVTCCLFSYRRICLCPEFLQTQAKNIIIPGMGIIFDIYRTDFKYHEHPESSLRFVQKHEMRYEYL